MCENVLYNDKAMRGLGGTPPVSLVQPYFQVRPKLHPSLAPPPGPLPHPHLHRSESPKFAVPRPTPHLTHLPLGLFLTRPAPRHLQCHDSPFFAIGE